MRTPTIEEKKILSERSPMSLYEALINSLGKKEEYDSYGKFSRMEDDTILIFSDVSYQGSPNYEIIDKKYLDPYQADALRTLDTDDLKETIKKASYEIERNQLQEQIERAKNQLEYCTMPLS